LGSSDDYRRYAQSVLEYNQTGMAMSDVYNLSSPHAPPTWQGNTYSLPITRRLYYYGVTIVAALFAAILIGAGILIVFQTFPSVPLLLDVHPVVRIVMGLISFLVGFLLLTFTVELYRTIARTRILIAPEGFIYSSNGGYMWSAWDNAVRIERLFLRNSWQEGIMLREPAHMAGRTLGFSIFSTAVLPRDRFIPLTPFGDLWRRQIADPTAMEDLARVARRFLPADSIPSATSMKGLLYHDIRHYAEHLFAREE
jgi:hypothetical protein